MAIHSHSSLNERSVELTARHTTSTDTNNVAVLLQGCEQRLAIPQQQALLGVCEWALTQAACCEEVRPLLRETALYFARSSVEPASPATRYDKLAANFRALVKIVLCFSRVRSFVNSASGLVRPQRNTCVTEGNYIPHVNNAHGRITQVHPCRGIEHAIVRRLVGEYCPRTNRVQA